MCSNGPEPDALKYSFLLCTILRIAWGCPSLPGLLGMVYYAKASREELSMTFFPLLPWAPTDFPYWREQETVIKTKHKEALATQQG